ncbi:hypothetical protein L7F22_064985 [Adiantum nelumboides]|nr:hypothetical protein [Adiantum nelumboides]
MQDEFWDALQSQFQFEFDASAHIVHEVNTPMIDVYKALCVPVASCKMYTADKVLESGYASDFDDKSNFLSDAEDGFLCGPSFNGASFAQELSHNKSVVFHMQDVKCSRKSFASDSFISSFFYHERDASNSCDRDEGVCTEDLIVSDTSDIANSKKNGFVHVLPLAGTDCGQKNSLVDKAFAACGEAMLPSGYLLDKHIVEPLEAIDEKSMDIKELEEVETLDEHDNDDKGWGFDVEEAEALAVTRAKAKGPINWREQKDVRDKVHEKVQKEQLEEPAKEGQDLKDYAEKNQQVDQQVEVLEAVETLPVGIVAPESMIEEQGIAELHVEA